MATIWVVTDLDGTLLDHDSYSYDAAMPAIEELKRRGIPLLINTSKTRAEVTGLREELGLVTPYMVENGAAAYWPTGWLPANGDGAESLADRPESEQVFGCARREILHVLSSLRTEHDFRFCGFSDMTTDDIVACTGLSAAAARKAGQRGFTEPLLWQDGEEQLGAFTKLLKSLGYSVTSGGRFVHISAPADKGTAMRWLARELIAEQPVIIALGDSDNDRPMLERAGWPVVVRRKHKPPLQVSHPNVQITDEPGPAGWNNAVLSILRTLDSNG